MVYCLSWASLKSRFYRRSFFLEAVLVFVLVFVLVAVALLDSGILVLVALVLGARDWLPVALVVPAGVPL